MIRETFKILETGKDRILTLYDDVNHPREKGAIPCFCSLILENSEKIVLLVVLYKKERIDQK